jgi:hypothetical protein
VKTVVKKAVYKLAAKKAAKKAKAAFFMVAEYKVKGREAAFLWYAYKKALVAELVAAGVVAA